MINCDAVLNADSNYIITNLLDVISVHMFMLCMMAMGGKRGYFSSLFHEATQAGV